MISTTRWCPLLMALVWAGLGGPVLAQNSISLNFGISNNDNNSVDAPETAVVGIPGAATVDGGFWNHATLRASGSGAPTDFTTATQAGNSIALADSFGNNAALLTSSGAFFSNFSDATDGAALGTTGESGLMQSYLLANNAESITVSNLSSDFTANGYDVYVFFDIGPFTRTYGLEITEGAGGNGVNETFFTADSAGADSDTNEDGLIDWMETISMAAGTAPLDANYAVFRSLTADSFTIAGGDTNRAAFNGFQIVAAQAVPEPASIALWLLVGLIGFAALCRIRRKGAA